MLLLPCDVFFSCRLNRKDKKPADDDCPVAELAVKPGVKIMMMG
jgi:hypothetical protein